MCFDAKELPVSGRELRGDYFSDYFTNFRIRLDRCENKTVAVNTTEQ